MKPRTNKLQAIASSEQLKYLKLHESLPMTEHQSTAENPRILLNCHDSQENVNKPRLQSTNYPTSSTVHRVRMS
jgi:hypothetical protein